MMSPRTRPVEPDIDCQKLRIFVRLINNQFTVDGMEQFAEALAHNTALKEIW